MGAPIPSIFLDDIFQILLQFHDAPVESCDAIPVEWVLGSTHPVCTKNLGDLTEFLARIVQHVVRLRL